MVKLVGVLWYIS